jgi:hypothetical protein
MRTLRTVLALATVLGAAAVASAQQQPPARVSPPGIAGATIDGARVAVYYSRPFTKDPKTGEARKIWGGLVPFDKVWRTGANEATLLVTEKPIEIAGTAVPAGAHSLYSIPSEDGLKLIINKQVGQPGTTYNEKEDLARIDMKKESTEKPVDQFTITVSRNPDGGGILKMAWEDRQYTVPFTVKK